MLKTTWQEIFYSLSEKEKAIVKNFDRALQDMILRDVEEEILDGNPINEKIFGKRLGFAQRMLAAHHTVKIIEDAAAPGSISGETVGDFTRTYTMKRNNSSSEDLNGEYKTTSYGFNYVSFRKKKLKTFIPFGVA